MNVAKIEHLLRNMKDYENQLATPKIRHSKKAYNYYRF